MPEGSSSAAPVTKPGPSNRSTMFWGFLTSERIVSVMKILDARDQTDQLYETFSSSTGKQVHTFNTEIPREVPWQQTLLARDAERGANRSYGASYANKRAIASTP